MPARIVSDHESFDGSVSAFSRSSRAPAVRVRPRASAASASTNSDGSPFSRTPRSASAAASSPRNAPSARHDRPPRLRVLDERQRREQGLARGGRADLAERRRGLGAHGPERVRAQRTGERADRLGARVLRERRRRPHAEHDRRDPTRGALRCASRPRSSVHAASHSPSGSKRTTSGFDGNGTWNACVRSTIARRRVSRRSPATSSTVSVPRKAEAVDGSLACVCSSLHDGDLVRLVPAPRRLELGMPGPEDPLVEEPVDPAARDLLDRAAQVVGHDALALVRAAVVPDRLPEEFLAELGAQHVEHPAALLVEVAVEDVDRLVVVLADDRPAVLAAVLGEVALGRREDVLARLVLAEVVLAVDRPRSTWRSPRSASAWPQSRQVRRSPNHWWASSCATRSSAS